MLLYVSVMFKPLIPIISDALSHTFAEAIHIATVHAKYGNNHLEKELADTNADNKDQNTAKSEEAFPVHVSTDNYDYRFYLNKIDRSYSDLKLNHLPAVFISMPVPPPKIC